MRELWSSYPRPARLVLPTPASCSADCHGFLLAVEGGPFAVGEISTAGDVEGLLARSLQPAIGDAVGAGPSILLIGAATAAADADAALLAAPAANPLAAVADVGPAAVVTAPPAPAVGLALVLPPGGGARMLSRASFRM